MLVRLILRTLGEQAETPPREDSVEDLELVCGYNRDPTHMGVSEN